MDGLFLHRLSLPNPQCHLARIGWGAGSDIGETSARKFSRLIIRQRFLSEDSKRNIDSIRQGLEGKKKLTFGVFLFYAFSPLPSNCLFIAYGLTNMQLRLIALPFFLGRSLSYSFWGHGSAAASRALAIESTEALSYLSVYFVASQILLLYLVYLYTRVDWHRLFVERKLRFLPPQASAPRAR